MNRDPLYDKIIERLPLVTDHLLFERCVCSLLRGHWPNLIPATGGDDAGVDGQWANESGRGILCFTTEENVLRNVTKSLKKHMAEGQGKKQVLVATSRHLTPRKCRNIEKRVVELGYTLAFAPYTRDAIAELLLHNSRWLKQLLGISGKPAALSCRPRSLRPRICSTAIGRDREFDWLVQSSDDRLLVGQPGIGKTFVLQRFVDEGLGLFLTSTDEGEIANAIRDQQPSTIVIEDAHGRLDTIEFLLHYRDQFDCDFRVVADCWPGSAEKVAHSLGLRDSCVQSLQPLSDQQIVELVKECGISGPNEFFHVVVQQAMGYPGRAVMLAAACIGGTRSDFENVWTGESLAAWLRPRLTALIDDDAVQILACFAVGGQCGVTMGLVAEVLGYPVGRVMQIANDLSLGGVIYDLGNGNVSVVPRSLRPILVRDYFFSSPARIPLEPFLNQSQSAASVVQSVIGAECRGAKVSANKLADLVQSVDDISTWKAYTYSCESHAEFLLEHRPDLVRDVAFELLRSAPRKTIPFLLRASEGDDRPLNAATDHPLGLIGDWAKSGLPGTIEAVARRRIVWNAGEDCLEEGMSIDLVLKLIPIIASPMFEDTQNDPGNHMQLTLRHGVMTADELLEIDKLWDEILVRLSGVEFHNWNAILQALQGWLFPNFGASVASDEHRKVLDDSARKILPEFAKLGAERPGVLTTLSRLADSYNVPLHGDIDPTFSVLFPGRPRGTTDEKIDLQLQLQNDAIELARSWSERPPAAVIATIQQCIDQSKLMKDPWPDHCRVCCEEISKCVVQQQTWIDAIITQNARADLLRPFLMEAAQSKEVGWEARLKKCLGDTTYVWQAVEVALIHSSVESELRKTAVEQCGSVPELVENLTLRHPLSTETIEAFLTHSSKDVVQNALTGLWYCRRIRPLPSELLPVWRTAIVLHCDDAFYLEEFFKSDTSLQRQWIRHWSSAPNPNGIYFSERVFHHAVAGVSSRDRIELLKVVEAGSWFGRRLVSVLVGRSAEAYESLLSDPRLKNLHEVPLFRRPDKTWEAFVPIARRHGVSSERIVHNSRNSSAEMEPVPQKYEREIATWRLLNEHPNLDVRKCAAIGKEHAESDLKSWLDEEERERLR